MRAFLFRFFSPRSSASPPAASMVGCVCCVCVIHHVLVSGQTRQKAPCRQGRGQTHSLLLKLLSPPPQHYMTLTSPSCSAPNSAGAEPPPDPQPLQVWVWVCVMLCECMHEGSFNVSNDGMNLIDRHVNLA